MTQQRWTKDSPAARLIEALVVAAPEGVRFDKGKPSAGARFPEFRAWHALLKPFFGIQPPEWEQTVHFQPALTSLDETEDEDASGEEDE